ncbi:follicle cell protein 3C-1-like isoform X3 [Metopolophium dirhodum]|uniref:follicle cell protein 3C-1-like isoform X3 n=1 Tax=Metopolophium dirhodum TaxID=44670 RepID=UPI00298FE5CA|nr:follicle cell protein 3C-1-like isoform X3 [Metopolophium dirhodum]
MMMMMMTTTMVSLAVALGSISPCFADQSDGGDEQKPVQKLNEMLNHVPAVKPLPFAQSLSSSTTKTPCICGVFLSSQITKGSKKQPTGYAALLHEQDEPAPCNALGVKTCTNKCLEIIAKHLPNSPAIICGSVDRDVYKERAHLFVKNCNDSWINTLLSTGKEFCCKDGQHYKCPVL